MSQVKEWPILFNGPMVRAILEGRKTVTRRPIKPSMRGFNVSFELHQQEDESWRPMHTFDESCMDDQGTEHPIACPYGRPGERLWVRETFNRTNPGGTEGVYYYRADGGFPKCIGGGKFTGVESWKPSIHMPRAACRILLEITGVRVERLQDISEEQARAEGIVGVPFRPDDGFPICTGYMVGPDDGKSVLETTAAKAFAKLWQSTGGDWDANPWVWVVEFRRVQP